jgi:8-oxo-dGTP pyrophosphatase MutT (NUDIX family)
VASQSDGVVPTPLPAATVMLLRDGAHGLEVFMLERNPHSGFVPGAFLFPGGGVDLDDAAPGLLGRCRGRDDVGASAVLGLESGGLAHWVAALREAFEEAGVLLADPPLAPAARAERRRQVDGGSVPFSTVCEEEDLVLAVDEVWAFSHWITPVGQPRRYDTRFFVAAEPVGQEPTADLTETVAHLWIRPAEGLRRNAEGTFPLIEPTLQSLRTLAGFERAEQVLDAARAAERHALEHGPTWVGPPGGRRIPLPGDAELDGAMR